MTFTPSRLVTLLTGLMLMIATIAATTATSDAKRGKHRTHSDRNGDRIPDRWERSHRLSLRVNQARRDQDHDGLRNRDEYLAGMSPRDSDSDDDGVRDGSEGAGRVLSFVDGVLTVEPLAGGEAVKARVDARTEIDCERRCERADDRRARSASRGDDDASERDTRVETQGRLELGERERHDDDDRDDHGRDDDRHESGDDDHQACTVSPADLKPGVVLQEAELELRADGAYWSELRVVRPAAPAAPAT